MSGELPVEYKYTFNPLVEQARRQLESVEPAGIDAMIREINRTLQFSSALADLDPLTFETVVPMITTLSKTFRGNLHSSIFNNNQLNLYYSLIALLMIGSLTLILESDNSTSPKVNELYQALYIETRRLLEISQLFNMSSAFADTSSISRVIAA
jgi:hypothetical protein